MTLRLPQYIRVQNEFEDTLCSVEMVARLLPDTEQDSHVWKWVIIAMQNGLQGAMVCALSGTDGTGALESKSQTKVWKWLTENHITKNGRWPEPRMADFGTLLSRVQNPELVRDGPPLDLTTGSLNDLTKLNKLRRDFAHFTPKGWSIEAAGLPRIMLTSLDAIEWLMLKNDRVLVHLDEDEQERLRTAIAKVRALLRSLARHA